MYRVCRVRNFVKMKKSCGHSNIVICVSVKEKLEKKPQQPNVAHTSEYIISRVLLIDELNLGTALTLDSQRGSHTESHES